MKNFILLCLTVGLLIPNTIFSQNFVDAEIDGLSEKLASIVNAKNNSVKAKHRHTTLLIEDFTDTEGKVSKLGASLAEEFSLALSNFGVTFSITGAQDLASAPKPKSKFNLGKALQGAGKLVDGVTSDYDYEKIQRNREAATAIDGAADIGTSFQKDRSNYKGVDAVVTGTLTESNDQYRLLIKVISMRSGNAIIANVKGFVTKTPFILALEEEENVRLQSASNNSTLGSNGSGSGFSRAANVFESNNTKVELLGLRQVGQNIECRIRITNTGPDVNFYLYKNDGKLIDSNNSYDYWATQVGLGELIDNNRVSKTLVTNNSVEAKIIYGGVSRDVHRIAKLTVQCFKQGGNYFYIEFRDIPVN